MERVLTWTTSFYCMLELEELGYTSFQFRVYRKKFESVFARKLRDYLFLICVGEARHAYEQTRKVIFPQLMPHSKGKNWRNSVYQDAVFFDPVASSKNLLYVFNDCYWYNSSYGGKNWGCLVNLYLKYGQVSDRLFIDMVLNKQHNNGTVFNKKIIFSDETTCINSNRDQTWLNTFLDERREHSPIKTVYNFYFPLAPEVKNFIKDAADKGFLKIQEEDFCDERVIDLNHNIEFGNVPLIMLKKGDAGFKSAVKEYCTADDEEEYDDEEKYDDEEEEHEEHDDEEEEHEEHEEYGEEVGNYDGYCDGISTIHKNPRVSHGAHSCV